MKRQNRPQRKEQRNQEIFHLILLGGKQANVALQYGISVSRVRQIVQKESRWAQKMET